MNTPSYPECQADQWQESSAGSVRERLMELDIHLMAQGAPPQAGLAMECPCDAKAKHRVLYNGRPAFFCNDCLRVMWEQSVGEAIRRFFPSPQPWFKIPMEVKP